MKIGPTADDLAGLFEYHLDFPGNALEPGCTYELWARRLTQGDDPASTPTCHRPGAREARAAVLVLLRLQRLQQHARGRLGDGPARLRRRRRGGGARRATGGGRVQLARGRREGSVGRRQARDRRRDPPRRLPGRRARTPTSSPTALYLGSSAEAGVGCDDTRGPHREVTPAVITIPSDPAAAADAFPWITFEGRWGELQKAFFNGPTGPNMKTQWTDADRVVRGLARPQLRRPDRGSARDGRHRLLLLRRRARLGCAERAAPKPDRGFLVIAASSGCSPSS